MTGGPHVRLSVTPDQAQLMHRAVKGALHARIRDLEKSMPLGRRESIRREIDKLQALLNHLAPHVDQPTRVRAKEHHQW